MFGKKWGIALAAVLAFTSTSIETYAGDNPWAELAHRPAEKNTATIQIKNVETWGITSAGCAEEARLRVNADFNQVEMQAALARGPERDDGDAGVAAHALADASIQDTSSFLLLLSVTAAHGAIAKNVAWAGCTIDPGVMTFYKGARDDNSVQMVAGGHQFLLVTVSLAHAVRGIAALQSTPRMITQNPRVTGVVRDAFGTLTARTQPQIALAAAVPLSSASRFAGSAAGLTIDRLLQESSDDLVSQSRSPQSGGPSTSPLTNNLSNPGELPKLVVVLTLGSVLAAATLMASDSSDGPTLQGRFGTINPSRRTMPTPERDKKEKSEDRETGALDESRALPGATDGKDFLGQRAPKTKEQRAGLFSGLYH